MKNILKSWFKKPDDRFYKFHKMMCESFIEQTCFYDSEYKTRVVLISSSCWGDDFMTSNYEFVAVSPAGLRRRYYPNKVVLSIFDARFRIKPIITCK